MVSKTIAVDPIDVSLQTIKVPIRALHGSTLLMNKMRDKERQAMLDKVTGKGTDKSKIRNLEEEAEEKIWYDENKNIGFPASGFKQAIVEAAVYADIKGGKKLANSIQVLGNIVPLKYMKKDINKSITYDSGMTKAPRETWRPEFYEWTCEVVVTFNSKAISPEQVINLFRLAGFHIGIGSWRPYTKKTGGGNHGMFEIAGK